MRKGDCPDLPKPGWTGEFEWDGWIPYDELPEAGRPREGYIVTANNRIVGDDYPHHITSDWLDGYRAARIEQLLGAATSTTSTTSGDAARRLLDPRCRDGAPARAPAPAEPARDAARSSG